MSQRPYIPAGAPGSTERPRPYIPAGAPGASAGAKPAKESTASDEDLKSEEEELLAKMRTLARKSKNLKDKEKVDAEIKEALADGRTGRATILQKDEAKRLRRKLRELKDVVEIKRTETAMRTIACAADRPQACREIAVVLTRDELRRVIWALSHYENFMAHANDRAIDTTKIDKAIGSGDFVEYLLKCAVLSNVGWHLEGGRIKKGELGPFYIIDGLEDWPVIEED